MPPRNRNNRDAPIDDVLRREELVQLRRQIEQLSAQVAAMNAHQDAPHATDADSDGDDVNPFADPDAVPHPNDRRWETGLRVDLPEFAGDLQPDDFIDWLSTVEEILDFKSVPPNSRVPLITTRLRGRAQAWWQQLKGLRLRQGKPKINSWEKFRKHMKAAFLPFNYERDLYQRLQLLRQGQKSVDDYTREFYQLLARTELSEAPTHLVSRYIGGLRIPLQDVLNMFDPLTVSEAHQRALQAEKQLARRAGIASNPSTSPPTSSSRPPLSTSSAAPQPGQPSATSTPSFRCFNCGETGHRQANCPRLLNRTLATLETDVEGEHIGASADTSTTEYLEGDIGPLLMLHRTFLAPRAPPEDLLRNSIFKSTCTIAGKVCRFIIDSGSCENVVSETTIQKLGLTTEPHPHPYKLAWLSRGADIMVSHRALLSLSIGSSYSDEVLCDIVPMDACHLLLGRPWQYDRATFHDGRTNTYSFLFRGKKIILVPSPDKIVSDLHPNATLLTRAPFVNSMTGSGVVSILDVNKVAAPPDIPSSVQSFLSELEDPSDLSVGLPPLSDIHRDIDLVPSAALPGHLRTSNIFNVQHLTAYVGDNPFDSRANPSHPGGDDVDHSRIS